MAVAVPVWGTCNIARLSQRTYFSSLTCERVMHACACAAVQQAALLKLMQGQACPCLHVHGTWISLKVCRYNVYVLFHCVHAWLFAWACAYVLYSVVFSRYVHIGEDMWIHVHENRYMCIYVDLYVNAVPHCINSLRCTAEYNGTGRFLYMQEFRNIPVRKRTGANLRSIGVRSVC